MKLVISKIGYWVLIALQKSYFKKHEPLKIRTWLDFIEFHSIVNSSKKSIYFTKALNSNIHPHIL